MKSNTNHKYRNKIKGKKEIKSDIELNPLGPTCNLLP